MVTFFEDKAAFITGGAPGIGLATGRAFAEAQMERLAKAGRCAIGLAVPIVFVDVTKNWRRLAACALLNIPSMRPRNRAESTSPMRAKIRPRDGR